jgi:hypothetical protein
MQANRIGLPHFEQGRIPISARLCNGFRCMDDIMLPLYWAGALPISLSPKAACSQGDGVSMLFRVRGHWSIWLTFMQLYLLRATLRNLRRLTPFALCPIRDARQLVNAMKKVLLATVAILAFAAPSFGAEPAKTVGQAPPSGAASFYLAQDTATMKCQIVETQPAAGGSLKVVGAAHPTKASAETALTADKTCK